MWFELVIRGSRPGIKQLKTVANFSAAPILRSASEAGARMGRVDKLIARFKSRPKDFSWDELVRLLTALGYREIKTGKSGGSRRKFIHDSAPTIALHKPHPGNIVKSYVIDYVLETLIEEKLI